MLKVTVICDELTTEIFETDIPEFATDTVAPETKFVPVSVTGTDVPWNPVLGFMDVKVNGPGLIVRLRL